MFKICVIGTGYVGLVSGVCFAHIGNTVVCVDSNPDKITMLNRGEMPIFEPDLTELVEKNTAEGRLTFTTDLAAAVRQSDIIFIAVGTPQGLDGGADLSQVDAVAGEIGKAMNGKKIIVNKSTVPVGTGERVRGIVTRASQGAYPFAIVSNPEFLREGSAIADTFNPDRVVIGTDDQDAVETMIELHKPFNAPVVTTDLPSAEMIKYASNAFLAVKISFINEVANLCERLGADVTTVAHGMGYDRRIGSRFLNAGLGFGGACFPKDSKALIHMGQEQGVPMRIMDSVLETNEQQRLRAVDKLEKMIGPLAGKHIALWGLAFKPNTNDMREAPSLTIFEQLRQRGARVTAYDPVAMPEAKHFAPELEYKESALAAAQGADALILVTEWQEFAAVNLTELHSSMAHAVVVDGRNLFDPAEMKKLGFAYESIGRPAL